MSSPQALTQMAFLMLLAAVPIGMTVPAHASDDVDLIGEEAETPAFSADAPMLRIGGDPEAIALGQALERSYEAQFPGRNLEVTERETDAVIRSVAEGDLDLGLINRPLTQAELNRGLSATPLLEGYSFVYQGNAPDVTTRSFLGFATSPTSQALLTTVAQTAARTAGEPSDGAAEPDGETIEGAAEPDDDVGAETGAIAPDADPDTDPDTDPETDAPADADPDADIPLAPGETPVPPPGAEQARPNPSANALDTPETEEGGGFPWWWLLLLLLGIPLLLWLLRGRRSATPTEPPPPGGVPPTTGMTAATPPQTLASASLAEPPTEEDLPITAGDLDTADDEAMQASPPPVIPPTVLPPPPPPRSMPTGLTPPAADLQGSAEERTVPPLVPPLSTPEPTPETVAPSDAELEPPTAIPPATGSAEEAGMGSAGIPPVVPPVDAAAAEPEAELEAEPEAEIAAPGVGPAAAAAVAAAMMAAAAAAAAETEPEAEPEPEAEAVAAPDAEPVPEAEPAPEAEAVAAPEPDVELPAEPAAMATPESDAEAEPDVEVLPEPEPVEEPPVITPAAAETPPTEEAAEVPLAETMPELEIPASPALVGMGAVAGAGLVGLIAAARGGDRPAQEALQEASTITLDPQENQRLQVSWTVLDDYRAAFHKEGLDQPRLRIYDATAIDLRTQPPHQTYEYLVDETAGELLVPDLAGDRDYVAELGYYGQDGDWLPVGRSLHAHVPVALMGASVAAMNGQGQAEPPAEPIPEPPAEVEPEGAIALPVSGLPIVSTQSCGASLTIDSRDHCYVLDEDQLQKLQSSSNFIHLEPGTYLICIEKGEFSPSNSPAEADAEPVVLLWIYGGKVMNQKTQVEVGCTWSSLNGYSDMLTLQVLEDAQLCALFFDTFGHDQHGEITLQILRDD